ncbi:hypothetical protein SAMN05216371_3875 [Streptomyces sp. TLI_053]|uniref:hypothetical protein n=1 Tax=Streptomyces sp. TLI_053 TaxID=1855352 RepID=UPI00087BEF08|nr:hypothetical protein [Streptomyces sp. TLI_053]SDT69941.1 hypothetical protein SAMN05216371_3875 [Streptomyces sp. TLI_053]
MHQIIGWLLSRVRTLLAPGPGRRARRPQHLTALRETALALITPPPAPSPVRPPINGLSCGPWAHRPRPYEPQAASVRPYVSWDAWLAELDAMEMEVQHEVAQQARRRAAAAAASAGHPDPGYTYTGAHHFAGAQA